MRILLFILLIGYYNLLQSQANPSPTLLIILGRYTHHTSTTGYVLNVNFIEDPSKCDPVKGFVPLEDQIKNFKESLVAIGFSDTIMQPTRQYEPSLTRRQQFKISSPDWNKLPDLFTIIHQYDLKPGTLYYAFPAKEYDDEDEWAIQAYRNARATAEMLAAHLGQRIKRIVCVDDDTRVPSIYSKEKARGYSFDFLETLSKYETMGFSEDRENSYTLRVTFELE